MFVCENVITARRIKPWKNITGRHIWEKNEDIPIGYLI
jgi:hypothetical protein